jgi:hypothetical protein
VGDEVHTKPSRLAGTVTAVPLVLSILLLALLLLWLVIPLIATVGGVHSGAGFGPPFLPPAVFVCTDSDKNPLGFISSVAFIVAGLGGFIAGNLAGGLRAKFDAPADGGHALYEVVITAFLLAAAIALGYETFGTWLTDHDSTSAYWPITSYVRCGINHYPVYAAVPAVLIPYLIGHWLHRRA